MCLTGAVMLTWHDHTGVSGCHILAWRGGVLRRSSGQSRSVGIGRIETKHDDRSLASIRPEASGLLDRRLLGLFGCGRRPRGPLAGERAPSSRGAWGSRVRPSVEEGQVAHRLGTRLRVRHDLVPER